MTIFGRRKPKENDENPARVRWNMIVALVWGLNKTQFNKLIETVQAVWEAYNANNNIKTTDDKIYDADKKLMIDKEGD